MSDEPRCGGCGEPARHLSLGRTWCDSCGDYVPSETGGADPSFADEWSYVGPRTEQ